MSPKRSWRIWVRGFAACRVGHRLVVRVEFSKGSGWLLKIQDRRKARCYVIPHDKGFAVRATVREIEREALSKRSDSKP
jgi:hypothetical protein